MQSTRKPYWMVLFTLLMILTCFADAQTEVLSFEDLYTGYGTFDLLPQGYGGFTWQNAAYVTKDYVYQGMGSYYDPALAYGVIGNVALSNAYGWDITMSGSPFNFIGVYITQTDWSDITGEVQVKGWREGNLIYDQTVVVSLYSRQWFRFDYMNIDTINLAPWYFSAFDNFTYHQAPIPEPTTMILLGSGLIGLAGYGRKKFLKN